MLLCQNRVIIQVNMMQQMRCNLLITATRGTEYNLRYVQITLYTS